MYKDTRYSLNKRFFENIDTEEKAYLLGFVFADGTICINPEKSYNRLSITVTEQDIEILEFFKKYIYPDSNLLKFDPKPAIWPNGKTYKSKPWCRFSVNCPDIVNDLGSHGVLPRKTYLNNNVPNIPKHLLHHFIRGYFDGDGSVCISVVNRKSGREKGNQTVNRGFTIISKSILMLEDMQTILSTNSISSSINKDGRGNHVLSICALLELQKLEQYLYADSNLYLKRKRVKFKQALITSSAAKELKNSGGM